MWHWTLHLNRGTKRSFDAAVAVGHKLYSFGGYCDLIDRDHQIAVHLFNTLSLRWTQLPPPVTTGRGEEQPPEAPSNRVLHTAVLIEDIVYIWGGVVKFQIREHANGISFQGNHSTVLCAFDVDAHRWFEPSVSGTVPEGRRNHSACVLDKVMFVCGGWNQLTRWTNDMYKLDTSTMVWSLINPRGPAPPASENHSATIIGTKMFVFGGYFQGQCRNTIRVFDTETNFWLRTPSAQLLTEGRSGHSAFTYNGELYICGGWKYSNGIRTTLNDVWRFNPDTFSRKKVEPKGKLPYSICRMSCCMVGDRIVLFRGYRDKPSVLYVLDVNPGLKMLCKLAVIQYGLEQSELPHDIRWELATMTENPLMTTYCEV